VKRHSKLCASMLVSMWGVWKGEEEKGRKKGGSKKKETRTKVQKMCRDCLQRGNRPAFSKSRKDVERK